jgi:hypothetical protein
MQPLKNLNLQAVLTAAFGVAVALAVQPIAVVAFAPSLFSSQQPSQATTTYAQPRSLKSSTFSTAPSSYCSSSCTSSALSVSAEHHTDTNTNEEGRNDDTNNMNPASKFYNLEEMEDAEKCTTEVFLSKDGTISLSPTATDGPPPLSASGTWTTNALQQLPYQDAITNSDGSTFRMVITRTFGTLDDSEEMGFTSSKSSNNNNSGTNGKKDLAMGDFTFDVTRIYTGNIQKVGDLLEVEGIVHISDGFFGDMEVGYFGMIDTTDARLGN